VLRRVLYRYVPEELIERPKMGFGIPLGAWLRGPLREWAEPLLSDAALRKHGLLDPAPIRAKWDEHLAGRYDWNFYLWGILMLQVWLDAAA
jgi:asparagine synthase (glutamine-hydrolysing)